MLTPRRALFVGIPLVGHLHPLIMQAAELASRGWDVAVATHDEAAPYVEARPERVRCIRLGSIGPAVPSWEELEEKVTRETSFLRSSIDLMLWFGARWTRTFDGTLRAIGSFRPETVVADIVTLGALDAAEARGLKVLVNNADLLGAISARLLPPAPELPLFLSGKSRHDVRWIDGVMAPWRIALAVAVSRSVLGKPLNALRRARGLPEVDIHERLRGRTILVNGAFGVEYERPLPDWIHMVGPMLPTGALPPLEPELHAWLCDGPPVVYATLGTVARAGDAILGPLLQGFASDKFRVLWSLRSTASTLRLAPPANVRAVPSVSSALGVMAHPNVRAVFSHGGINTTYEALAMGKPLVVLPLFADQQDMAFRVADAGAGIRLDKTKLTAGAVSESLARVLGDARFREPLPRLMTAVRAAGGVKRAADLIEREPPT